MTRDPLAGDPGTPVPPSAIASDSPEARELRRRIVAAIGDQYELGAELGRGGMAVVYAARDVRLRRPVALKVLPPDMAFRSDVRTRFVREAQTAARLNHPNIVPIYAVDERDSIVYFAMALVDGESLADVIKREKRPDVHFIGRVLEQVADALSYAHACGVVHRDIKPDNILLDRESGRAVVTDFGIARAAESGARLTQTGIAVGTPAFMSPEQATGEREVDGRSDIYSVGVVGYLMLAGRLPFEASSTPAMLIKHVTEVPPPIRDIRPDAPRPLGRVLERCLQKKPAERYEDARTLRDALRQAMQQVSHDLAHGVLPAAEPRARDVAPPVPYPPREGSRAEHWSPRVPSANAPTSPNGSAPQGAPPPLDPNATSGEFRNWRRAVRAHRREQRERGHLAPRDSHDAATRTPDAQVEVLVRRFQGKVIRNVVLSGGLLFINAATGGMPWFVFPVFGLAMHTVNEYVRLRDHGVRWRDIFSGGKREEVAVSNEPIGARIRREVLRLRQRTKWFVGSAATAVTSFAIGGAFNLDPMIVPFVASVAAGIVSLQLSLVSASRLRHMGVAIGDALGSNWEKVVHRPDDRPREVRLAEELHQLVGESVIRSRYGNLLRDAVEDRVTIRDAQARLSDADRALVPDVAPTADALLERIGAAATALERLDHDLPAGAVNDLDRRIRDIESEPAHAFDRERRLNLLQRQRASLVELDERRTTIKRQLDNASMALRSLRLDMVKLRTLGVGAAIDDVTGATQEARALSVEIGRALEIADEVRKI